MRFCDCYNMEDFFSNKKERTIEDALVRRQGLIPLRRLSAT